MKKKKTEANHTHSHAAFQLKIDLMIFSRHLLRTMHIKHNEHLTKVYIYKSEYFSNHQTDSNN